MSIRRLAAAAIALVVVTCIPDQGPTHGRASVAGVTISPAEGSLVVGESLPFRVRTFDAFGRELRRREVVWTSRNPHTAPISATGRARGAAAGSTYVVAAVGGITDSARVRVISPRRASAGDNEPAGYRPIASHTFRCIPGSGCEGESGTWRTRRSDVEEGRITLVDEGLDILFPRGWEDGRSPARIDGWSSDQPGTEDYRAVYVRLEMQLVGVDWENQSVGTKIFYVAYGDNRRQNHGYVMQSHQGGQAARGAFSLNPWLSEAGPDGRMPGGGAERRSGNAGAGAALSTGRWHEVELLMEMNEPGRPSGRARLWIDGVATHDARRLRLRGPVDSMGFHWFQITPVYGGVSGDVKTRDDHMRLRSVYISADTTRPRFRP